MYLPEIQPSIHLASQYGIGLEQLQMAAYRGAIYPEYRKKNTEYLLLTASWSQANGLTHGMIEPEHRIQIAEYIMIWGKWLHRQVWYSQEREQTRDITRIHQCLPFLCKQCNAKNITLFMIKRAEDLSIITHQDPTSTCVMKTISI